MKWAYPEYPEACLLKPNAWGEADNIISNP